MLNYNELLNITPFGLNKKDKKTFLIEVMNFLTRLHYDNCKEYKDILDTISWDITKTYELEEIPFLPVRLFKEYDLFSINRDDVVKTLTSSGTSGQRVSKIFLDKETALNQTKTLTRIVSSFIGTERVPMIVLDTAKVLKDRAMFSARGAGIQGFSIFSRERIFAFDDDMNLDLVGINQFLKKYEDKPILLFGFTFIVWKHFYETLKLSGEKIDLSRGIMFHGGGWKNMDSIKVGSTEFRNALHEVCCINPKLVYEYYGMVEQTGTIYVECEEGHLHTSSFSDIIIRRPKDYSIADRGEPGLIELVSILPKSYPGHVILTEDLGVLLGEDDCVCGRHGKFFKILGRIKNAEVRGCSDTYGNK